MEASGDAHRVLHEYSEHRGRDEEHSKALVRGWRKLVQEARAGSRASWAKDDAYHLVDSSFQLYIDYTSLTLLILPASLRV